MTTFEALILLALTAIVIITAIGFYAIIQETKAAIEEYKRTWSHFDFDNVDFDNVVCQLYGIKEYEESIYNAICADGTMISKKLTSIANHTYAVEQAVKDLLAFETRNEKRNDEMFARAEEINKLQLKELQQRVNPYNVKTNSALDGINEVEQDKSNKV